MNKKTIYLMGATIVILLLFVIYLVMQQQTPVPKTSIQTQTASNQNTYGNSTNGSTAGNSTGGSINVSQRPEISSSPLTADQTAKEFYDYYYASATNPLANGAYKSNKYLSQDFKDDIGPYYKNGNTPVFCPQNQRATVDVGQDQQVFYDNGYLTQAIISDIASKKNLYRVLLQNLTGAWQITDINCIK